MSQISVAPVIYNPCGRGLIRSMDADSDSSVFRKHGVPNLLTDNLRLHTIRRYTGAQRQAAAVLDDLGERGRKSCNKAVR